MNTHEMTHVCDKDGWEVWLCLECGRQYRVQWNPWRRIVDEPGDESTLHTGSKGGLSINGMTVEIDA